MGNGLTYNRENAAASAAFFDVGDTWTEDTPTFTQQTATLKILGGDADIDNFLIATRSNVQDLEAAVVHLLAPAPPLPPTPCAQSHTCATLVNIGCRSVLSYKRINRIVWCVTPNQGSNYS
ncbi:MAG: hypothetical protein IIB87_06745 [Chloroflexi bacterium]|nr:hypothetical protein [Chloroflexota bacterium]